ncbi:MAG TPA: hypothetical protein VF916_14385 [Ktedonobacterales bacterium]
MLAARDPHTNAYQPTPRPWTFTLRERGAAIMLDAVLDGAETTEVHEPARCDGWQADAARVLTVMTGWELPHDIIDYAAQVLRVRSSVLGESTTSRQLEDLLTMYECAHAAAARGRPWLATEYAQVL